MQDSPYTNPSTIRATYAARGANRKLNIAKAESLGMNASEISPSVARSGSSTGGSVAASSGSGGSGGTIDPTLTYQSQPTYDSTTYQDTTYEGSLYKQEPEGTEPQGIV